MNINLSKTVVFSFLALTVLGCAIPNNKTLVTNTSNLGLDFDSVPPRVALAISSTKGIITPAFEGGQTLPALSGMSTRGNVINRFIHGLSSTMATGDAAYTMSFLYADCNPDIKPVPKPPEVKLTRKPRMDAGGGRVRPAVIVSNTITGAMVSFTTPVPLFISSVKAGFNRHEEITTPVSVSIVYDGPEIDHYVASTPSFLATIDQWIDLKEKAHKSGDTSQQPLKYLQFFAIGDSADNLTLRSDIRQALFKRMFPEMKDTFCEQDAETRAW